MITRMKLSFVCAIFISFYLCDQLYAKRVIEFVKSVQNLSVKAVQNEKYTKNDDAYKFVKLNISWLPSNSNRQPLSYSIIVTSIPNIEEDIMECPEGSIFYTITDNKQSNVLLPESSDLSDLPDMYIQPSCSYKIQVIANPRINNITNPPEVLYTVPECIGHICSCRNAKLTLPIPKVNVTQIEHELIINWSIASNSSNVSLYVISIGIPLLTSRKGLLIYNITNIGEVSAGKTIFLWNLKSTDQHIRVEDGYKIIVTAVNNHGCFGKEGNFIVNSTLSSVRNTTLNHNIWFILCGVLSGCILFGVLSLILCHKYDYFIFNNTTNARIHTISKYRAHWTEAILQKHNILYGLCKFEEEHKEEMEKLQIPFESIKLIRKLGTGQFGKVYLGCLNNKNNTLVAVKMSQDINLSIKLETHKQFINEIELMRMAGTHPNVINLLGYCIQPNKSICIVLEYMQGGDLLTYLHTFKRKKQSSKIIQGDQDTLKSLLIPSISESKWYANQFGTYMNINSNCNEEIKNTKQQCIGQIEQYQFFKFAIDISMGMEHLELKEIIHRDLAARNILIDRNLNVKISDFGLSRNGIYKIKTTEEKSRHLPIRWMSPEALRDRVFTSKSDVWSYGIVLWEISTLGAFPYSNVQDDHLLRYVIHENGRLEQPENLPLNIYKIMCSCWTTNPEDRPNFTQLLSKLRTLTTSLDSLQSVSNPCYALSFSNENT